MPHETKPVYALESLPELIGERQFKMLCVALGINTDQSLITGEYVAGFIQGAYDRRSQDAAIRRQSSVDQLVEMLG
ncbi:hypothetical protein C5748_18230 [Phyllobacterium phragmitis]|uniref:Uncharacterized protein n=1 Tax=Phyllobacterium phragmitis TaxID=2670329 RepID=A0A2S9INJ2_9HYPH|nr:hypothetical protein C5748_18230 [Phyllobacterium phragmitis]